MEDTQYIGGNGIDTKLERDTINYVPSIQPPDRKEIKGTSSNTSNPIDTGLKPDTSSPSPVTDVYMRIGETYNFVNGLASQLQTELSTTIIPISSTNLKLIQNAQVVIDNMDKITGQGIPFSIYDKAIEHPDHPTYALIQEAVEEYAEDINGNIKLELYPDIKEMKLNLEEMHYLLSNAVYSQFVDAGQIPSTPTLDDTFYEALKSQEGKQTEAFTALERLHELNETVYYSLLTSAYESENYFNALEAYQQSKKDHEDFTRRLNQQSEFMTFAMMDTGMTQKCATKINRQINSDADVDEEEVKALLSKQYENVTDYLRACAQMKAAAKLQINKQREEKKQQKDLLKTTGGLAMKKRVHDEVMNLTNIRNEVFLDLYAMMNNMVEPTRSSGVENFLDQIAQGMDLVRENYKVYLQEMYQIHMIDQEVRSAKVNLTSEKQVARDSYWLLDNLLK